MIKYITGCKKCNLFPTNPLTICLVTPQVLSPLDIRVQVLTYSVLVPM